MAINLNHAQFGAQFTEFVDFATRNAGDPDTIVCLDDRERGRAPNQRRSVYAMIKDIVQSEEAQPGILPA